MKYIVHITNGDSQFETSIYIGPFDSVEIAEKYIKDHEFNISNTESNNDLRVRIYHMNEPVEHGIFLS